MTVVLIVLVAVLAAALAILVALHFKSLPRRVSHPPAKARHRILFPFIAQALSPRALDAALRLARAEDATLVPVFLARVPLRLPLDAPLPKQSEIALPLQEAIEQRAVASGIDVDSRIARGRTYLHALRQAIERERFDRIVVAAAAQGSPGFAPDDVAWLLENASGEIVVLRPGAEELLRPDAPRVRRRAPAARPGTDKTARVVAAG
jgi:hypothetical protein